MNIDNFIIIASLKSQPTIPSSHLLMSSLPGSASKMHVKLLCILEALYGKLDIKRHSPSIVY